jgi:hypothetical protein
MAVSPLILAPSVMLATALFMIGGLATSLFLALVTRQDERRSGILSLNNMIADRVTN